jgi:hypothetical protein
MNNARSYAKMKLKVVLYYANVAFSLWHSSSVSPCSYCIQLDLPTTRFSEKVLEDYNFIKLW